MMPRKIFIPVLIAIISLFGCEKKEKTADQPKPSAQVVANDLPVMSVELLSGSKISMKEVKGKMVLIMFMPDCEDCQREAQSIRENLISFSDYQLYFISSHPIEIIKEFAINQDLLSNENIQIGRTSVQEVLNSLGAIPVPSVYVFDANGKLTSKFIGETPVEQILKAL